MNDIELYFTEKGCGKPLILLHGNNESGNYFTHQMSFFSSNHRVIAIDTRGHGRSPRGTAPFTLDQFADDLCGFMMFRGIDKADIIGFSDGGNIALLFALKYPEKVDRLILNGANLFPSGVKASFRLPICFAYVATTVKNLFDRKAIARKEMLALMISQPHIDPEKLGKLGMPTLVIVGTDDMIKDKHSALIAHSIPNAQFVRIDGDHFIAAKNSETFNRAVDEFPK